MRRFNNKELQKIIIPAFYLVVIAVMTLYVLNEQSIVRNGGDSPLYRNLMDNPAWIRRGFDPAELTEMQRGTFDLADLDAGTWYSFKTTPLIVKNSLLPDLPKRKYLSPQRHEAEEFTIIIPIEIGEEVISYMEDSLRPGARLVVPAIFLAYIGENWAVFFNGTPVRREIHLDENGRMKEERTLRNVPFPIDRSLVKEGTNILAFRIIGDPTAIFTGLYYNAPHYMDEYRIIRERQNKLFNYFICSTFGFVGVYCLVLFLFFRNRREIFYLYFSIFSIMLCLNTAARDGLFGSMINSVIMFRLEFASLMLTMPFFYLFIESLVRGKVTKPAWGFLFFSLCFAITQVFFSNAYGADAVYVWLVASHLFFTYVIFYDIVYFYFLDRKNLKNNNEFSYSVITNIIAGILIMYFSGIYEIIDVIIFHKSYNVFSYSAFIVLVGMSFAMQQRFIEMYRKLEQSNIILEADFAQGILAAGQRHYQKMYGLYDTLRILRHDYKYHLRAIGDLVKSGDLERIKRYLGDLQVQAPENETMIFCSNPILNALLGNYAERCIKSNIQYNFELAIPDTLSISNHEMCIVMGNLLENAVEACQKIVPAIGVEQAGEGRSIELAIKTHGVYIAVMVKNSFSGVVVKKDGHPVSTKDNGGYGLRSVRLVAVRYDGYVHTKWDSDTFTAYVMLRM